MNEFNEPEQQATLPGEPVGHEWVTAVEATPPRKRRVGLIAAGVTALALGVVAAGVGVGYSLPTKSIETPHYNAQPGIYQQATAATSATPATDAQKVGVVTILTDLYYDSGAQAAGTGMILTSDGKILTNNHVIDGSTSIEVTVESTGKTYEATVVGTDAVDDVAVLQLVDASGLTPIALDKSGQAAVGDAITDVGNAEGTGDLVSASGTIAALDQTITVGDEYSNKSERLSGLMELDADVVSGDSGGPVFDAQGEVIGMATAASTGQRNITGYAIEITTALAIVDQIESGQESGNVSIGAAAFLGVEFAQDDPDTGAGAVIGDVIAGKPAAGAGLVAGDVITAVDGSPVTTQDSLRALISAHEPGDSVAVTYTDASGASQVVTVTLVAGPAA